MLVRSAFVSTALYKPVLPTSVHAVWVQHRGFKTLRKAARRQQSDAEGQGEAESYTPSFMKVSWTEVGPQETAKTVI